MPLPPRQCQQVVQGLTHPKIINHDMQQGGDGVVRSPSGSGKSTLIRTVNQLETIGSGEIGVDSQNMAAPR